MLNAGVQNAISIHSLVKRETETSCGHRSSKGISIHSLVKRETRCRLANAGETGYFNPLPRKEGDLNPLQNLV